MTDEHGPSGGAPAAGDFSAWLDEMLGALRGERAADVPCAGCTACCTSSQFVHIEPDETDTLAHIPPELLFPAPLAPRGHVVLGYDERGHCPMLVDDQCSIYEHRPRTCRTYDCRVFPAAGIEIGGRRQGRDRPPGAALAVQLSERRRPRTATTRCSRRRGSSRPRRAIGRRRATERDRAGRAAIEIHHDFL